MKIVSVRMPYTTKTTFMIRWLAASFASARPIDRPQDHQLQDDARRQAELRVERQQQERSTIAGEDAALRITGTQDR